MRDRAIGSTGIHGRIAAGATAVVLALGLAAVAGAASVATTPLGTTPDSVVDSTPDSVVDSGPAEPSAPDDLGDDPLLNERAQECFDGDLVACDLLFLHAPVGSPYEAYGDTCGGRQAPGSEDYCGIGAPHPTEDPVASGPPIGPHPSGPDPETVEPTPPVDLGDDPELDELAEGCYAGDMASCDALFFDAPADSEYRLYGDTCAGRQAAHTGTSCQAIEAPAPGTGPLDPDVSGPDVSEPAASDAPDAPVASTPTATPYTVPAVTLVAPPDPVPSTSPVVQTAAPLVTMTIPPIPPTVPAPTAPTPTYPAPMPTVPPLPGPTVGPTVPPLPGPTVGPAVPIAPAPTVGPPVLPTVPAVPTTAVAPATGVIAPPTISPLGLGDNGAMNALAQLCYDGDMAACDRLFTVAALDTPYHEYADTCAGRQPPGTEIWCVKAFPAAVSATTVAPALPTTPGALAPGVDPTGLGTDPALDALAGACSRGDMASCDALFVSAPVGSSYQQYGDTCGGRQKANSYTTCVSAFPAAGR